MKKQLLSLLIFAFGLSVYSQYIPNGGFETWDTTWMFRDPTQWKTGNLEFIGGNYLPAIRTDDSYSGEYAIQLRSASYQGNTIFGYMFSNGMINGDSPDDTLQYTGGFAITDSPDTLHGYFKYHISNNDTALGIVSFKKDGKVIAQNMIQIYGTVTDYVKMEFPLQDMVEVPDTAMIAFACTNAFNEPMPGNTLNIDSLWFTGTTDTILNCDFEKWDEMEYVDPRSWASLNEVIALNMGEASATSTADAHSGSFALRLESKAVPSFFEPGDTITAAIFLQQPGGGTLMQDQSNFQIDINPTSLTGFYKFIPVGDDTAGVQIILYDMDGYEYDFYSWLLDTNEYVAFEVPLSYPVGTVIQEISVVFTTSYREGLYGEIGSVLYIDDLDLVNSCEGIPELVIENTSVNACDPQTLDAGDGWDYYTWSTGEFERTTTVTDFNDYSVMVLDNTSGCYMMDTIYAGQELCDGIAETVQINSTFTIYPVPATENVNIDFSEMVPGNYIIELTTITGSIIRNESISLQNSSETLQLSITDLTSGLYLIKVTGDNFIQTEKLRIK